MVKNPPSSVGDALDPWVGNIPWRRKWQPTPAFLPGKSQGQKGLVGYSPWGRKELDMTEHIKEEEAGCGFIISDLEHLFLMLLFIARFPGIQIVYQ